MQTGNHVLGTNGDRARALLRRRVSRRSGFQKAGLLTMAALLLTSAACGGDDDDEEEDEDDD
jgi:hypothetical protein